MIANQTPRFHTRHRSTKIITALSPTIESQIYIYYTQDDPIVLLADAQLYKKQLPTATLTPLNNKAHLNTETFPELIEAINNHK